MCILKIYSDTKSFKKTAESSDLPVYSLYDKGEYRDKKKTKKHTEYRISFDVSDKDWDNFPGQVEDAIQFLTKHFAAIESIINSNETCDAYLDFPLYSRLNEEIINQNDHLPRQLVSLAGKLNLGIEMAIYSEEAFEEYS